MRVGLFELTVIDENGRILPEDIIDGVNYIASQEGKQYHVNVSVYRDPITKSFPAQYLRFGLFVDGIDVQYWKRLDLSNPETLPSPTDYKIPVCSKFWGFKTDLNELRSFQFRKPPSSNNDEDISGANFMLGRIKLVVYEARIIKGKVFQNQEKVKSISTDHSVGGKVLAQPSLVTEIGNVVTRETEKFIPLERWENASTVPLTTLELRYHSQSIIQLLKRVSSSEERISGKKREIKDLQLGGDITPPLPLNHTIQDGEEETAIGDGEVVIIKKKKIAPLVDLTNEVEPVWTMKEIS
jgi:hypothetical protein